MRPPFLDYNHHHQFRLEQGVFRLLISDDDDDDKSVNDDKENNLNTSGADDELSGSDDESTKSRKDDEDTEEKTIRNRGLRDYAPSIRYESERMGTVFDSRGASQFNDFIHSSGLFDLPLGGKRFTRMNNFCSKHIKIDRFFVSAHVIPKWPGSHVIALPREFFDHTPLFLKNLAPDFRPIPFRFYNSWLIHSDFADLVSTSWAFPCTGLHAVGFKVKLQRLKVDIKKWHLNVIQTEKALCQELRNKIHCLDTKAESSPLSPFEMESRISSIKLLADFEHRKVKDLKQKAKIRWASEGDENTQFFHGVINGRLNRSRINGFNINRDWLTDPVVIKNHIFDSFSSRFKEEEIKEAVWDCGSAKAPGLDGFTFKFFKKHWDTLIILSYVKEFEKWEDVIVIDDVDVPNEVVKTENNAEVKEEHKQDVSCFVEEKDEDVAENKNPWEVYDEVADEDVGDDENEVDDEDEWM
nr:hypothetical protein [Tanacetum cinerariifolium]